ncbi:MAG: T9SS type A sorting domain-containing protein [Flavobacteriales bacterium]|nr:T9SS type A sorting domain-containing protein [Flavobacteriales bacterium]
MRLSALLPALLPLLLTAQFDLTWAPDVPVSVAGTPLAMPWAGGLNFVQFSPIDIDMDGDEDLFLFDRSGDEVVILKNIGSTSAPVYRATREFDTIHPFDLLKEWALLRDYNCDGKADIFAYEPGGFVVYKNVSTPGAPAFQLLNPAGVGNLVHSNYQPTFANIYVTQVDLPSIVDMDNDGDLDILTFSIFGTYLDYHRNLTVETYGHCDSLAFEVRNRCWGSFAENFADNGVTLNVPCTYNVPNPEFPLVMEQWSGGGERGAELPPPSSGDLRSAAHAGSTVLAIDLNGDNVKDLLLGDISYGNVVALTNGGTVISSLMVSEEDDFPSYNVPVNLEIFPGMFHLDVNGDGKRDLLVSPNSATLAENKRSVWYYRNNGTDSAPVFQKQTEELFQSDMLDFGEGAFPVPFDHNGDGLMDLVVGNFGYYQSGGFYPCALALLLNVGTANAPAFSLANTDYMNLSGAGLCPAMHPAFGDVDGDGDKDMYIGDQNGYLHFYRNISTGSTANFQLVTNQVPHAGGSPIDVGQHAKPQFFDVDGDGKIDLLIGEANGNVNYYRNLGTTAAPLWGLENETLGNVTAAIPPSLLGHSVPVMFLNETGQREMLVGTMAGWIRHYTNIEGNLGGTFTMVDSTFQQIKEGWRSALAVYDFTGDGHPDIIAGNYRGGLSFYRNDFFLNMADRANSAAMDMFSLAPNPANESVQIAFHLPLSSLAQVQLLDVTGRLVMELPARNSRMEMNLMGLPPGLYSLRLVDGSGTWAQRLVVYR